MTNLFRPTAAALLLLLAGAGSALADSAMSLGVYYWTDPQGDPVRTQFLSIAGDQAEIEIDGPEGSKSDSRKATPAEAALLRAAVQEQISTLSLTGAEPPQGAYVTVDWHFTTDSGYGDGSMTYPLDQVPAAVLALQKTAFGGVYDGEKAASGN
ncbi:hypothetical protein FGG78_26545 [Thioclava sp. BHET1]|nr:hypothetical protein FGG78_26545 [Thioclava sp. BHET1]